MHKYKFVYATTTQQQQHRSVETPGFPDIKDIKQKVRDRINPEINLGHSDKKTFEAKNGDNNNKIM